MRFADTPIRIGMEVEDMASSVTGTPGFDVENMPDEELEQLIERAQAVLAGRVQRRIEELRLLARRAGFEVSVSRIGETVGVRRQARAPVAGRKPVEPKYRNPDDPGQTWSGRGREPKWLAEKLAFGRKRKEFAI